QRLVGHHGAELGTADADADDVADGLAGVPAPSTGTQLVTEGRHAVEHFVYFGHHVLAVDENLFAARRAQRHVQHRAFLRFVDLVAAEHGVAPGKHATRLRQLLQQAQGFVGDEVLGIIEVQPRTFDRQPRAAFAVGIEQLLQCGAAQRLPMFRKRLPFRRRTQRRRAHARAPCPADFDSTVELFRVMRSSKSFHDFTNDAAPSRCSCPANAASSMPAALNCAMTCSQSPPSLAIAPCNLPWSAKARMVLSGMVLMVSGAASASTYSVSGAFGSLVPVLAHSRRCGCTPAARIFFQRGVSRSSQYALYVRCPIAMPSRSFNSTGTLSTTATSQRLMNIEATESTLGDLPSAMRRSMPRIQASAAARYCSRENNSVTLIGTPR